MKLFKAIVNRSYIYAQSSLGETPCMAQVKFREAIVSAETKEEAFEKVYAVLPSKDPVMENILMRNSNGGKYYNIQIKELEGNDGVYFC